MFDQIRRRFLEAEPNPVFRGYKQPLHPWYVKLRNSVGLSVLIFVGLFYGLLAALFPYFLYYYLIFPLVLLALMLVWALPARQTYPRRTIEWLFWAFLISLLAWPNYLAIAIPGTPWITAQRLFLGPMVVLILISLSTNASFSRSMADALKSSKALVSLFLVFVAIQLFTTFISLGATTLNKFINNQLAWTAIFFVSCFLFSEDGRIERWFRTVTWLLVVACAFGLWEWWIRKVPWAGHIPSLLAIEDERVQNILSGDHMRAFTNKYRITGTFVTSLDLAEVLGLGAAVVVHQIVHARTAIGRAALIAFVPVLLFTIVQTDARLGNVAFFGSVLLYPLFWALRNWHQRKDSLLHPSVVLAYPAVVACFVTLSIVWRRLEVMTWGGGQQESSTQARAEQWALFWPKVAHWPFGYGPGQGGLILGWYSPDDTLSIDSYFISVALDYGVLGFFVFYGLLIWATFIAGRLYITRSAPAADAAIVPAVMLINFIAVKAVLSQENEHALIFMVLGMVVALAYRLKRNVGDTDHALAVRAEQTAPASVRS